MRLERDGPVARLTLDRPDHRNAVSLAMLEEIRGALGDVAASGEVRCLILGGAGGDFCSGADLGDLLGRSDEGAGLEYARAFEEVLGAVGALPGPVVARIQGAALGAGCQLAVACDLAVAAEDARLGIPSARLGVVINFESIERLVLAVGPKRAGYLLFTGRAVSGREAAEWGLVNAAVTAPDLDVAVDGLARSVAEAAPLSVQGSKRGIAVAREKLSVDRFAEGYRLADFDMMAAAAYGSEDLREGIAAFRERRTPEFRGR